ncbi:MAG: response regulator transcription factor [Bacteroidota bacterium]
MQEIQVAIVEDIHIIRDGLKNILDSTDGFCCTGVYNTGEEAAASLTALKPHVVLMDINLPGISGIECIRQVKQTIPETFFMMFTVYDDDEKIFDALKSGASGYLLKSTQPANILVAIRELYEGGSPMSALIARKVVGLLQGDQRKEPLNGMLSEREKEVLTLLSKGFLYKEIAGQLNISIGTVKQHIHKIYDKLHVQNRTEAINKVFPNGVS